MKLELQSFTMGDMGNNCYLLYDDKVKEAVLIDVANPYLEIKRFLRRRGLTLKYILLTHGHFDHIWGLNGFDVPFYVHPKDEEFLTDPRVNASLFCGAPVTVSKNPSLLEDGMSIDFCGCGIEVIHTPGHTPGSVCFKAGDRLFSGDTLFYHSVGRTDIPLASHREIIDSINNKLMVLDPATKVYPGHGQFTTIGEEEEHNPFLAG